MRRLVRWYLVVHATQAQAFKEDLPAPLSPAQSLAGAATATVRMFRCQTCSCLASTQPVQTSHRGLHDVALRTRSVYIWLRNVPESLLSAIL